MARKTRRLKPTRPAVLLRTLYAAAPEPVTVTVLAAELEMTEPDVRSLTASMASQGKIAYDPLTDQVTLARDDGPARCRCGMPAMLDADTCPACAPSGRKVAPRAKYRKARPGVWHPAPTRGSSPPPAPRSRSVSATCPTPLKAVYRSKRDALIVLARDRLLDQWPYLCTCGLWHAATQRWTAHWRVAVLDALLTDPDASIERADYDRAPSRSA